MFDHDTEINLRIGTLRQYLDMCAPTASITRLLDELNKEGVPFNTWGREVLAGPNAALWAAASRSPQAAAREAALQQTVGAMPNRGQEVSLIIYGEDLSLCDPWARAPEGAKGLPPDSVLIDLPRCESVCAINGQHFRHSWLMSDDQESCDVKGWGQITRSLLVCASDRSLSPMDPHFTQLMGHPSHDEAYAGARLQRLKDLVTLLRPGGPLLHQTSDRIIQGRSTGKAIRTYTPHFLRLPYIISPPFNIFGGFQSELSPIIQAMDRALAIRLCRLVVDAQFRNQEGF